MTLKSHTAIVLVVTSSSLVDGYQPTFRRNMRPPSGVSFGALPTKMRKRSHIIVATCLSDCIYVTTREPLKAFS
jgi:hypothetical protein